MGISSFDVRGSYWTVAMIFLFLGIATPAKAQSLAVNGVNFTLGESEAKARADISASGMEIFNAGSSFNLAVKQGGVYDFMGGIGFTNGKVESIQRHWFLNRTPEDKNTLLTIFYSATASLLEGSDHSVCALSVKSQDSSPTSGVAKMTTIECIQGIHIHLLTLIAVDCSAGCSIGNVSGSLTESIKTSD